jgi:hypothetical protein
MPIVKVFDRIEKPYQHLPNRFFSKNSKLLWGFIHELNPNKFSKVKKIYEARKLSYLENHHPFLTDLR